MIDGVYNDFQQEDICILSLYLNNDVNYFREKHPSQKIIIYQLEPLCCTDHWWKSDDIIRELKKADEIWEYDYQNLLYLKLHGINASFKPFIYSRHIDEIQNTTKDIDVLFFGTSSSKRYEWLQKMTFYLRQNTRTMMLANIFHPEINDYIARSKIVINIHNGETVKQQEQPRLGYLLANGKHIISERSYINYYNDLVTEVDSWQEMVAKIHETLDNYSDENELAIKNKFMNLTLDDITNHAKKCLHEKIAI